MVMALLTDTGYYDGAINQKLNLRRTFTQIMVSDSPFSILICEDAAFGCGSRIFQVLLFDIMLPDTLNMTHVGAISIPYTVWSGGRSSILSRCCNVAGGREPVVSETTVITLVERSRDGRNYQMTAILL